MIGYPPRARIRPASFLFGLLAGVVLAVVVAGIIWIEGFANSMDDDPVFKVVAVAWAAPRSGGDPFYQAVVTTRQNKDSESYEISAHIGLGSPNYTQPVGILGTVKSMKEALEKFGVIRWTPDEVTFGSETTVSASVKRNELEKHR